MDFIQEDKWIGLPVFVNEYFGLENFRTNILAPPEYLSYNIMKKKSGLHIVLHSVMKLNNIVIVAFENKYSAQTNTASPLSDSNGCPLYKQNITCIVNCKHCLYCLQMNNIKLTCISNIG